MEHEHQWEDNKELRQALENVRKILIEYANLLAEVANVPPLLILEPNMPTSTTIPKTTLKDEQLPFYSSNNK